MFTTRFLALSLVPAFAAAGLAACTTPQVKPVLSQAVVDARAHRSVTTVTAACGPLASPVSVGFGFGESELNELAGPALQTAGQQLSCHPQASALIVGQADSHGTAQEQAALARTRAQAVAKELQDRGVAAGRLHTQAEGKAPNGDDSRLIILAEGRRW